ncbi:MAG TPA: hypothetical protein VIW29_22290 [Polyangiaceae bacterium]
MKSPATTIVERPPPGPAQGPLPAPAWLVVLLAVALALVSALSLLRAWQRRRK